MTGIILDGKALAQKIEASLSQRVAKLMERTGRTPTLATLLVGDDPASATYVRMKGNACARVGMRSRKVELPSSTSTEELLSEIRRLSSDPEIQGILLQHPVPPQIDERACFEAIAVEKDVDGVTCLGFGRMSMGVPAYGSATPQGIMTLLRHYRIPLRGKHAVVVGRSAILGKPMAMMLLAESCTVTICHSKTEHLASLVGEAEIVVGAVGKPKLIRGDWIRDGAVVIDAGYHPGGVGDIELETVKDRASAWTPVPGGVGPMTISTLISQTVDAAEKSLSPPPALRDR
jgi:methylenetetrahydrofolate dehydrogenase (NADP+)/methenyltetrahydrofolate cyclohydrolase